MSSSSNSSKVQYRLSKISDSFNFSNMSTTIPFNPDSTEFPPRKQVPVVEGAPEGAAWVWGKDDNIGRLNLLTPTRVAAAAKEVKSGDIVNLNLPLDVPKVPAFGRQSFKHEIKALNPGLAYDDLYTLNTQSGTQWDGFRHIAHFSTGHFYNGMIGNDIQGEKANNKCSIQHWAEHGIAGRGILIDYWSYAQKEGIKYDPYTHHEIPYSSLAACAKFQGIDLRPASVGGSIQIGDILLVRSGFISAYNAKSDEERAKGALRHHVFGPEDDQRWAGLSQEEEMVDFLHDCYFAAVAGDAPSFEAWPNMREGDKYLHEYILAFWGMPLGEMFDLEKLAKTCSEKGRWTFFFTSAVNNCPGGVSSHGNALAIF